MDFSDYSQGFSVSIINNQQAGDFPLTRSDFKKIKRRIAPAMSNVSTSAMISSFNLIVNNV